LHTSAASRLFDASDKMSRKEEEEDDEESVVALH
jgi:hypothetical protein